MNERMSIVSRRLQCGLRLGVRRLGGASAALKKWAFWRPLGAYALLLLVTGALSPVHAQSRTAFLVDRLKADDSRVRTQAALALGGTNDDAAVMPLCAAINDDSDLVRQSVAVALKRLNRATAAECLRTRLSVEKVASVKLQLTRALEAVDVAPTSVASAKYYVALSSVTNNSGRPQTEIDRLVLGAVREKFLSLGGYQIAPEKEAPDVARGVLSKRKLKGYYLSISVDRLDYADGNLRVRVKLAVFTYPGKDLRGEVPAGITQTGVRPNDKAAEDNLIAIAAGRAVELFAQNFQ